MLLIGNGRVLTRNGAEFIENGVVAIEGRYIKEVGPFSALIQAYPGAEFLDAGGGLIMPGLINTHNHIYSAFARGLSLPGYNPRNFNDILEGMWWKIDRCLTLENDRLSAMAVYLDCIKNGVTTVYDHHASFGYIKDSLFAIADAAGEMGVRTNLCFEVSDRDGAEKAKEAVMENARFIGHALSDKTGMLGAMMGLHASFTISDATMALAREHTPEGIGFHIHVAEGMDDVYDSLKKYGKRVVFRLFDNDILGEKTVLGHCIHVNNAEMELIKHENTMVVHNPESNMGNAVGCPPCMEMMRRGILLGLGTDGYTNDMYESMKAANCLHKHNTCDPNAAWAEVPQMLFQNNAEIAGRWFKAPLGALEEGALADVIVSDYMPLTPMTADNCNGHTLFGMTGRQVVTTIINGQVRMENRELIGIDEEEILAKCREHAGLLWDRMNYGK